MKKITLLCTADDKDETLRTLRSLGAVHITPVTPPRSDDLTKLQGKLKQAKSTQVILDSYRKKSKIPEQELSSADKTSIMDTAADLFKQQKQLATSLNSLNKEKLAAEPYGNFDPEMINKLLAKGLHIKLFHVSKKQNIPTPEGTQMFLLSQNSDDQYIALVGQEDFEFDGQEAPLPERPLNEIIDNIKTTSNDLVTTEDQLAALSKNQDAVKAVVSELEADIELIETREGMGISSGIVYIQGFCPDNLTNLLLEKSKQHGWGIIIDEPANDEPVPTLIKSPAWVKPIKSLFTMLDILPGYTEIDIRPVFYIFFGLFFAMLVNDAGYGLLFLISACIFRGIFKKAPSGPFVLVGILSICAIIWGVLTGSYFGIEHLPPLLDNARIEWLHSEENIMLFAFLIGAVHLTIAHVWRGILMINSTRALGQLGWIFVTWCCYFLSRSLILGIDKPFYFWGLGITGLSLVVLFIIPVKHLKTEWADLVMLPFDAVGNFADLVSYVRLFAVGSASLAVAEAFNELAIGNGIDSIGSGIKAVVILLFGHILNIILALMSILVHGVRLNTLEFSGHIGLEWSGFKYKPFAEQTTGNEE